MDFLTNLFTSIFTPGPTPSLVRATNIAFFSLQIVLSLLLAATYSIHFVILSFLCAGLWWGVNWFVRELEEANAKEREKEKERSAKEGAKGGSSGGGGGSEGDDEEDDGGSGTETEDMKAGAGEEETAGPVVGGGNFAGVEGGDVKKMLKPEAAELRRRKQSFGEGSSQGELSTDSEWDKVEEAGEIKR
ncbi:uncharacterized protein KY384_002685 [Bacidia gigantensis]|uniref:uncharacterized protein n=1 Tax=Bacidia gigantensis TaxID=2732470 RepID=UPI001D050EB5|nr:uncharacterized protein KY384_002685 [Bacidia gigantensis]KAG8532807.1 hypothetical protein KY384_002685 [Bacidia gigantensis]